LLAVLALVWLWYITFQSRRGGLGWVVAGAISLIAMLFVWIAIENAKRDELTRREQTLRQMDVFMRFLSSFSDRASGVDFTDLQSVATALKDDEAWGGYTASSYKMVLQNKDAWGEPFKYFIHPKGEATLAVLRSTGPNRRDDGGTGDDIEVEVHIEVFR
jgi:hypothetical protein